MRSASAGTSHSRCARLGRRELRVVVDTNVCVSGIIAPDSPPGAVLEAVRRGRIEAVASWDLAEEIIDVLRRPRLRRYAVTERDLEDVLVLLAPLLPAVDVEIEIRDPDDTVVVAAAIAAGADAIVTGDQDLLDDEALVAWLRHRGVDVLSPRTLLAALG
jgi:uncharacterized protein